MAQRHKEKKPAVTDEESAEAGSESEEGAEDALARVRATTGISTPVLRTADTPDRLGWAA